MIAIKVKDVTTSSSDVEVEATLIEIGEPRLVNTRFGQRRVATAVLEDDTGRINLSLWEEQIDQVKEGQKVKVSGCYVTEWNNQMQLNLTRQGKIEAVK